MHTQTLRAALQGSADRLARSRVAGSARRDAELLLLHILGCTRAHLLTHPEQLLTAEQQSSYDAAITRRTTAEPVQYITGTQEFYGLTFRVTPAVLIPRPETEHLVEAALELVSRDEPLRIADVGTGSGILAITLAHQLAHATVTATDLSPAALAVARENAEALGVADRIRFLETDLLGAVNRAVDGESFDLIVSNPPYVPDSDVLEAQVVEFEPHLALFAGRDGLTIYRRLIPQAARLLTSGGHLLLEIGYDQRESVAGLLRAAGLVEIRFVPDLQGIQRVAVGRKA